MILEGTSAKGLAVPLLGAAGTVTGLVEIFMGQPSILGPMNLSVGAFLIALWWFGNRIARVAERYIERQGEVHMALPSRVDKLEGAVKQLVERLDQFAVSFNEERTETREFREQLIKTLENHTVRIEHLERQK